VKALILAAGYATRLRPLTLNRPKSLLPISGQPMIDYVIRKIDEVDKVDHIFVVVNRRFLNNFQAWVGSTPTSKPAELINNETTCNEDRLGAVADMNFAVEKRGIQDDLLVVGGDNLFDFGLEEFVSFFEQKGTSVALHDCGDLLSARRFSNVELDEEGRIVFFEEKPEKPRSSVVAICLYLFEASSLGLLTSYLEDGGNRDAPGHFIEWLHKKIPVYGKVMGGIWFDIGNKESYREADRMFPGKATGPPKFGASRTVEGRE